MINLCSVRNREEIDLSFPVFESALINSETFAINTGGKYIIIVNARTIIIANVNHKLNIKAIHVIAMK